MNSVYIYHHLGLGDHIICNAIVRTNAVKYDWVYLFSKSKNVIRMFRDLSNLRVISLDNDISFFIQINPLKNYLIIGHTAEWFKKLHTGIFKTFDEGFYISAGIPIEDRWNKFHMERDLSREKETYYDKLKLKDNQEYIFLHNDLRTGREINFSHIRKDIKIINPSDFNNIGIFDFIYTIEKAAEVHVIDSSFSCLIDTMQIDTKSLFLHSYARSDSPNPKFKLNWKIL
jgi:hypothetical protein